MGLLQRIKNFFGMLFGGFVESAEESVPLERRLAYDRVLGEAADMTGCPHLLAVLPPGDELDHERQRVERLLVQHGLLPPPYAA